MVRGAFERRGTALEDEFFHRVDQKLILSFKERQHHQLQEEWLQHATGIVDRQVLEELRKAEITPRTLVAFSIFPAVFVAWADGRVEAAERKAVLKAAKDQGIFAVSPSYELLESWLRTRLSQELIAAWKDFIHAIRPTISDQAFRELRHSALERAEAISKAAGGFLGIHSVSQAEQSALAELNGVFDHASAQPNLRNEKMSESDSEERLLRESPLGESLNDSQLALLASCATHSVLPASTVLFSEGAAADALRIICSGSVALDMRVPPRGSVRILTLGAGDVLGWSALVGDGQMSATATVIEDAELLILPSDGLLEICDADADTGRATMRHVAQALARRLRETRLQLLDLFAETEPGKAIR